MKEISLITYEIYSIPEFRFIIYCLKIIGKKHPLSFWSSNILWDWNFHQRSPLEVCRWHHFLIFVDNIGLWYVSTIPHYLQTAWRESSVKHQHRWKNLITIISSWKHIHFSKNLFFYENYCMLQDSFRGCYRKRGKILSNVTSLRSAMILKNTLIKGIFLRFS